MPDEPSRGAALSQLTNLAEDGDLARGPRRLPFFGWRGFPARESDWHALAGAFALVGVLTLAGFWIEPLIKEPNLAILYMLAVVLTALRWGRRAAILSAISAALLYDYFFVPPLRGFGVNDVWYLISLAALMAVGLLVSMLTLTAREEAAASRVREEQTAALYSLTKALASGSGIEDILALTERHIFQTFHKSLQIWMPGEKGLTPRGQDGSPADEDREAAEWVFRTGQEAGRGAAQFSGSGTHYLPLKTWKGVVGVLGIRADSDREWLPRERRQLLEAFANQTALAVTRVVLAKEAQRMEVLQEADKLQKALLNSISHNLRTPLASVMGALNSVLEDRALLDESSRQDLLKTARSEAMRLNRLLQNLLDMTRLEGGAVHLKTEPHDLQDAVGAALEQLAPIARDRRIIVNIPPGLPLVPMDFVPIVQVLVNLLDNALRYSPENQAVEVDAALEADRVRVRVADSGIGIPAQDLERVFEKFFRGESAETSGGVGLGLSICKGLIEAHHGTIWARRRARGGTEVHFTLPLGSKP